MIADTKKQTQTQAQFSPAPDHYGSLEQGNPFSLGTSENSFEAQRHLITRVRFMKKILTLLWYKVTHTKSIALTQSCEIYQNMR